jgi:3-phenylpropionate/trans-cinnamate dioxygenase ferredoxin reductase subunit
MADGAAGVVVVGGGLAGAKTAEALRDQGYDGAVTLIGVEDELPYERPPLSKGYLAGAVGFDEAIVHPESWYAEHAVELRRGTEVSALHLDEHEVELSGGERVGYAELVLATGAEPRRLSLPGAETALTLRTRADADRLRETFGPGRRLAVIGAGWIGLEAAAAARGAGTEVTVLEAGELPLLGVLGPELGPVFAQLHRDHGVDLRLGARITGITEEGVALADGSVVAADAVLAGVGVSPRTALAEAAGLAVDNGVLVDAALRTSDPHVFAIGDIANHDHPVLGHRIRVEHWNTALRQPETVAAVVLGRDATYDELPYFFSDQYDLGAEYVGHATREATARVVVRGDLAAREFVAFWLDAEDRILAAMNVNVWDVVDEVRPLILGRTPVDVDRLTDPGTAYSELRR